MTGIVMLAHDDSFFRPRNQSIERFVTKGVSCSIYARSTCSVVKYTLRMPTSTSTSSATENRMGGYAELWYPIASEPPAFSCGSTPPWPLSGKPSWQAAAMSNMYQYCPKPGLDETWMRLTDTQFPVVKEKDVCMQVVVAFVIKQDAV